MSGLDAANCVLNMLNKLQKRLYKTAGPTLAAFLESLAYRLANLKPVFH